MLAETFTGREQVCPQEVVLPEHQPKQALHKTDAKVFHAECRCDVIVGRDVLRAFGIKLDFESDAVVVDGVSRPMRSFPEPAQDVNSVDILLQGGIFAQNDQK